MVVSSPSLPPGFVPGSSAGAGGIAPARLPYTGSGYTNLKRSNTVDFRNALAALRGGTANLKLACIGDSTTRGLGGNNGNSGDVARSYPSQMAPLLASALGVTAGIGNLIGGSAGGATPVTGLDSRVTFGGGWTSSAGTTAGGTLMTSTTAGTLTFTPTAAFDTVDIYYPRNSGWGTWNADIAGGSATLITNSNANAFLKATLTGSLAVQAVNCVHAAGSAFLSGIDTYDSATKQISVWNMGWSGAKASDWNNSTWLYGPRNSLSLYAPHMSVICLGINDMLAATATATFKTNLLAVVNAARAVGGVILAIPVAISTASASQAVQDRICNAIRELAVSEDLPLVDFRPLLGSYAAGNEAGLYFGANHPNGDGYALVASHMAEVLSAFG